MRIERLVADGVVARRKRHADQGRTFRIWLLRKAARGLGVAALMAPWPLSALVAAGFAALAALHANGGCASQAFARNMTWQDGVVGFIDLEQDPLTAMPLEAAQARDVVLYVYSTARFMRDDLEAYRRLVRAHIANEPPAVVAFVAQCARRLAWLQPLLRALGRHGQPVALPLRKLAYGALPYAGVQTA